MTDDRRELSIDELADQADVPVRTVRYYISEGLLPGPGSRGRAASYGEEHLLRLQLIRALAARHVPLAEQRARLAGLTVAELRALLVEEEAAARRQVTEASPRDYIAGLLSRAREQRKPIPSGLKPVPSAPAPDAGEAWRRWVLAPGVELHLRADAVQTERALVERLLRAAGLDPNSFGR